MRISFNFEWRGDQFQSQLVASLFHYRFGTKIPDLNKWQDHHGSRVAFISYGHMARQKPR
jgi:hypothetical protein